MARSRATPTGSLRCAATSATDVGVSQSLQIVRFSMANAEALDRPRFVTRTIASSASSVDVRTLPPVMVDGRIRRCFSSAVSIIGAGRPGAVPQLWGQKRFGLVDQDRHFVADEPDVAVGVSHHGKAGTIADFGDEQKRMFHLDDDLMDPASAKTPCSAVGQADEPRGDRSEAIGGVAVEAVGQCHGSSSKETTTASFTPATRSTKLATSQFTFMTAVLTGMGFRQLVRRDAARLAWGFLPL